MQIIRASRDLYQKYREDILDIFLDVISMEMYSQYVDPEVESAYHDDMFEKGYYLLALEDDKLIGYIAAYPLAEEPLLPNEIKEKYQPERCDYLSEMHIKADRRRQGIGTKLMEAYLKGVDHDAYDHAVVRAWTVEGGAGPFYKRFGFEDDAIIDQVKTTKDGKGKRTIQKQYFFKKL